MGEPGRGKQERPQPSLEVELLIVELKILDNLVILINVKLRH